jgi:uncharacterized protein (DUF1778 family)
MTSTAVDQAATTDFAEKRERLDVRLSHEQKVMMQRAAALEGTTLSNFVIRSVQQAAERAIREHQVITLSARDSLVFADALLNPPAPSAGLRAAAARYQQMVEEA